MFVIIIIALFFPTVNNVNSMYCQMCKSATHEFFRVGLRHLGLIYAVGKHFFTPRDPIF